MPLPAGTRLGPYEITAPIGAGGMGEVYKARDTRLDRTVAIKVLPPQLASDVERRARFTREAKTISALSHPHICTLYDVGEQAGTAFLVMEHLEGETLAARLGRGALPLAQALDCATEIADALAAAHKQGVIHRDLKPGNVMLTKQGVKLLDFGLAKLRRHGEQPVAATLASTPTETEPLTGQGTILGTLQYMAPEQLEGKPADARTDLFAFGAIVYEMVTGTRAFEGNSAASLIGAILERNPVPLAQRQPLTPPALEHVVDVCLAKDPDQRWQSAADVKRELTWTASSMSAVGAGAVTTRLSRRIPWLWWLSIAAPLTALAVVLLPALRQWSTSSSEPEVIRFSILPPDNMMFAATGAGVPSTQLAVSPDGRRLAFVAAAPGGQPALWVRALDTVQPQRLAGTEDASYPFWSPDGRFIGFFAQRKLKKVDITGGPPQALCDVAADARGGTWNRDGIIAFAPGTASGLSQVPAAGGVPAPLLTLRQGEFAYRWPSWLPDGRRFLFYVRGAAERRGVYLGSLDGKTRTRLMDAPFSARYAPPGHLLTVREGTLLAYPFDEKRERIAGNPVRVAEQVAGSSTQLASFSVSATGVLAYSSGLATLSRLEWFDRQGRALGAATDVGDYVNFRLSPDGRRVAVSRVDPQTNTGEIWLLEPARDVLTRFTFDPANDVAPIWSPDGKRIIFRSDRAGGNFLFDKPSSGGEPERQLGSFEAQFPTDWSPDGKFIVYHAASSTNLSYDVFVFALTGGAKPQPFADSPFAEIDGHLSPDARWLAYASDESGHMEVYVQALPRSGSKWQVSTGGGSEPHWRRDGKELFYLSPDRKIMAVAVGGAPTFEADTPRPLFQTRAPFPGSIYRMNYDVTGDGTRFLVNTLIEGASSSPINVVFNWPASLVK